MDRLARRIFVIVALFVLVVTGTLVVRSRAMRTEAVGPTPSAADLSIREVELQEETADGARWQLVADQAQVFDAEGRTALRNVRVRVQDRERTWTITGEEGDYFKTAKDFELRGSVVIVSDDGLRLETTVLRWKGDGRRLWTDAPVRITRDGTVIEGTALEMKMAEEATTVGGRVRAVFQPGQRS
ncbi:MAG TPA: LPS export ABC transporter periplasmic protein LptC [Methylomirabilota bacterium]|nr:LPS export ABC transporter periplasmic protein LptC [Methylomirabilota bacterium]